MITAVETSVLLDIFTADPVYGERSKRALREDLSKGKLIACEVTVAEVGAFFPDAETLYDALERIGVEFSPMDLHSSYHAGNIWKEYRKAGGKRNRVISDFLIGAHAESCADQLLTRDRGYYRSYFKRLQIHDPAQS